MITKAQIDTLTEPTTIVIIADGGTDSEVVERWLRKAAPKVVEEQRYYSELHLALLQPGQAVCALFRSPETPALEYYTDASGRQLSKMRPDEQLFPELVITKPVKTADFWQRANPRTPGHINTTEFLQALNESLIPMRLDYTDKGEHKPSILKLKTL